MNRADFKDLVLDPFPSVRKSLLEKLELQHYWHSQLQTHAQRTKDFNNSGSNIKKKPIDHVQNHMGRIEAISKETEKLNLKENLNLANVASLGYEVALDD